jgi:CrcB protein
MSLLSTAAVFVGGGSGACGRYTLGRWLTARYPGVLPLGTMLINISGCFALGLTATLLAAMPGDTALLTALVATGFLGGYTTFSAYALEGLLLWADRRQTAAALSLLGSVAAGLLAAGAGAAIGQVL